MHTIPFVKQGTHRAVGVLALLALASGAVGLGGCKDESLQTEGQRCGGEWGGCVKGLRCSFKKKRCYRPVDCAHLERRMKACLTEVVSVYAPQLTKLPAAKRASLLDRIGHHLQTEMVDHCKYDAAAYQKKHGTTPTQTKSYGQDPRGKKITACLKQQSCRSFATCMLELTRVMGPSRPKAGTQAVFPIAPPRPAPEAQTDGGVPAGGTDAMEPGTDAMEPAMKAVPPARITAPARMAAPAMPASRPAMPAARPSKPAPRPR